MKVLLTGTLERVRQEYANIQILNHGTKEEVQQV